MKSASVIQGASRHTLTVTIGQRDILGRGPSYRSAKSGKLRVICAGDEGLQEGRELVGVEGVDQN